MPFENILGHDRPKELILSTLERGRLGHAYLFSGPDGVGKTLFALDVARVLFCGSENQRPCGACRDCRLGEYGGHPDLTLVAPQEDSRFIKVTQALELNRTLSLKPVQAKVRVAIVRGAESMNQEAANTLLKTLEEPPPFAHIILTSAQPRSLPDTIRSRCQEVRFGPLSAEQVRRVLALRAEISAENAALAARFANGSPGRALQVAESGCLEVYENLVERTFALPEEDLFDLSAAIIEWARSAASKLEPQRVRLRELLRLLGCAYRDLLAGDADAPDGVPAIVPAGPLSVQIILKVEDSLCEARRQIDANASLSLVIESLLARIADLQSPQCAAAAG